MEKGARLRHYSRRLSVALINAVSILDKTSNSCSKRLKGKPGVIESRQKKKNVSSVCGFKSELKKFSDSHSP